jgi:uncharacterized membrane protein
VIAALRRIHPGIILATLDLIGLAIAGYLTVVELQGDLPYCGPLKGCEEVARSEYSRVGGIPVAMFGVVLSISLFLLVIAWMRSGRIEFLAAQYALSLIGVVVMVYFTYVEVFVIGAVCIWCASYGMTLVAGFAVALVAWRGRAAGAGRRSIS